MPSATPTTEVFAFSEPVVKQGRGELRVAVRLVDGMFALTGTRSVWANLFGHLRTVFEPKVSRDDRDGRDAPKSASGSKVRHRVCHYPAAYDLMIAENAANAGLTWSDLAKKHGVKVCNFSAWSSQRRRRGKTCVAPVAAVARHPILKPGGKIL